METQQIHDDEISRRYLAGEHALAIAGELNLRAAEVIGRIRALGLLPAGMAERRPPPAPQPQSSPRPARIAATRPPAAAAATVEQTETEATDTPARARLPVRRPAKPASARPSARHPVEDAVFDDEDGADSDLVSVKGCPRGWLVTEAEMERIYRAMGGRYEDVRFKSAANPTQSLRCAA